MRPLRLAAAALGLVLLTLNLARAATTNLPASMLIGDSDGIHIPQDGIYYIQAENMRAGDVLTKTLTLQNTERDVAFSLYLTSIPGKTSGPIDLLDRIWLELRLGSNLIYNGRLYGDAGTNMVKNPLYLGDYGFGNKETLSIRLTLDRALPDELFKEESEAYINWRFVAVKREGNPVLPIIPRTGDNTPVTLVYLLLCASVIALETLLIWKAKKREHL